MLCEKCEKNQATFHYTEVVNGKKSEHHLCKQCAANTDMSFYTSFFDNDIQFRKLLSGLLASQGEDIGDLAGSDPATKVQCPKCGMSYGEFIESSEFGCADCYDVFGPLITDTIRKIQGSDKHTGKKPLAFCESPLEKDEYKISEEPAKVDIKKEIDILNKKLKEAILLEDFSEAANLRDRIAELKKGLE